MSTANEQDDVEFEQIQSLARQAAPAIPDGPHATDAELGRMRAGADDPSLDAAYRHVGACSACREALVKSNVVALAPKRSAARAKGRAMGFAVAAAAAVLLAFGATRVLHTDDRLAVSQRATAGWMGVHEGGVHDVAPEDRNIEIRIPFEERSPAAILITCDESGHAIAPPVPFIQDARGSLAVVVAPRTYSAHTGPAIGFVVAGSADAMHALRDDDVAQPKGKPLDAIAENLRAHGGSGARVERIVIGAE